jgi:hypothetical protein
MPLRTVQIKCPKNEFLCLGLILGGDATTLGSVSRMDTRDGTIGLPVVVRSQYRWFC